MTTAYNEEVTIIQQRHRDQFAQIFTTGDSKRKLLEAERIALRKQEEQLQNLGYRNESQAKNVTELKDMNQRAIFAQTRVNEDMLLLAREQEKEKAKLRVHITALQKKLDTKQKLELETACWKESVKVLKDITVRADSLKCAENIAELANILEAEETD